MKPHETTLDNGLRIIAVPMKDNPTVTVLVMVEAGTKYETKEQNGISHFLEHMCFKGTKNRETPFDITSELDGLGAESNAFTWYEYTGYYSKARPEHFNKLLDVVSDIYLNSTFPAAEIEKEKGVIVEEMNMYKDLPARHVHDRFYELLYGDQPAGWKVLGTEEAVRSLTQADFQDYHDNHYIPQATTVVVAGDIDRNEVIEKVSAAFEQAEADKKSDKPAVYESQAAPQVLLDSRKTDQTHLVLGMRAYPYSDESSHSASVLSSVLGSGMSSRLFQKLRHEMGVCYYVKSENESYTDTGILKIYTGVDNSRVEEVVEVLIEELRKIRDEGVQEEELTRAKEFHAGNMLMGVERSNEQAFHYGEQSTMHEKLETPEQEAKHYMAVTAQDIKAVCDEIIRADNLNLAMVGEYENDEKLLNIMKNLQ